MNKEQRRIQFRNTVMNLRVHQTARYSRTTDTLSANQGLLSMKLVTDTRLIRSESVPVGKVHIPPAGKPLY